MRSWRAGLGALTWVLIVGAGATIGCSAGKAKAIGSEGGTCYGNGSCDTGLVCLSHFCVNAGGSGGAAGGGSGGGGKLSGGGGSAGAVGAAGSSGADGGSAGAGGASGVGGAAVGTGGAAGASACGNGTKDPGETCDTAVAAGAGACPTSCDDGDPCTTNTLVGGGTCQAACTFAPITLPVSGDGCCPSGQTGDVDSDCPPTRLDIAVDQPTVTTELGTANTLTVTLSASSGFAGHVDLAATVADPGGSPLQGWSIVLDATGLDLPRNGTATAHATVSIPTQNEGLAATVKLTASSSAMRGTASATSSFTVLNQYTIGVSVGQDGLCVYPPPGLTTLTVGSKLRWLNNSSSTTIVIHVDGNGTGCAHQSTTPGAGSPPGSAYECTITGVSDPSMPADWYCHSPGGTIVTGLLFQTVP